MLPPYRHSRCFNGLTICLAACAMCGRSDAAAPAQVSNPIGRIARIFDSQLVKVEDRVEWIDKKLSSYAQHYTYPLKVGVGFRASRGIPGDPDPSITLDLGSEMPIDSIYLVPAQREFLEDSGIFPKRFTLELSNRADFAQRTILYTSGPISAPRTDGLPVTFHSKDKARFVRLTVQEGHNKGTADLFGLSEFVVISNGDPASFQASVSTVGAINTEKTWYPEALVDGRTPLGIWQNGSKPNLNSGDSVVVIDPDETTTWTVQLDSSAPIDRMVLFPFQFDRSTDSTIFPEALEIRIGREDGSPGELVYEWANPLQGSISMTPMVIPLHGKPVKTVHVIATQPWMMANQKIHGLSEIEVWSEGRNVAKGHDISRSHDGQTLTVTNLTDGFSSESQILPVGAWFQQLRERGQLERELESLRAFHRQLASRSELNATWGSAVILGLTFLIPVFIVERRRLMSKDQLDKIRKRIASDLHDDIGSNLGSISLIARTARKDLVRLDGPEEVAEDLDEVESIARESSLAMRDIVWLLERQQDSIGDLVHRMRETANRLLREVTYELECESTKTASKLSLDAKRHLFLFYKEAIHNILKHSQANKVTIRLWDEDDKLALEILDNGIGLPTDAKNMPATVNKLEDRARVLAGHLKVTSSKGTGTQIRLLVRRSYLTNQPATA